MSEYKYLAKWRTKTKQLLVDCLGGSCNKCGYSQCLASLDFHHLLQKDADISKLLSCPTKLTAIVQEARKCIVLCKNCHNELHYGFWQLSDIDPKVFDDAKLLELTVKVFPICQHCKKNPVANRIYKFCSEECRTAHRTKRIPDATTLERLLWEEPTTHIAKRYKVSDRAVGKWAKKFGLSKPPRGYWTKHKNYEGGQNFVNIAVDQQRWMTDIVTKSVG